MPTARSPPTRPACPGTRCSRTWKCSRDLEARAHLRAARGGQGLRSEGRGGAAACAPPLRWSVGVGVDLAEEPVVLAVRPCGEEQRARRPVVPALAELERPEPVD